MSAFLTHASLPVLALSLSLSQSALAADAAPAAAASESQLPTVRAKASRESSDRLITAERAAQAGKSAVAIQDQPFAITLIDVEQLRETGAKNVQDVLLYSAGVYAGRYGFDTRGDWAAVRGMGPATYLDGLRGLVGFYNSVRPEIYALSGVEVMKGPSSVLYGQAELGGIVNAVSKRPQAVASREIELQLGSYQRKQAALDFTGPLSEDKRWQYRLVALVRKADTQVDHVNDDAMLLMPSVSWQPSSDTKLTAQFVHQRNDSKVSSQFLPFKGTLGAAPLGQIPASRFAGEPGWDRYDTRKTELSLALEQRLAPSWKLLVNARNTDSESVTREIWTTVGAIPDDAGNISRTVHAADRATDVQMVDARLEADLRWGPTRHQLVIGVDHQRAFWEEFNYFNRTGVGSFNLYNPVYGSTPGLDLNALPLADRPDNRIVQTGLYVSEHLRWGPWIVSGAWRRDQARNETLPVSGAATVVRNGASTGRLGLMFQFDNGLSPYLSWADAFVPNLGNDGTPAAGFLKPTTGRQQEAGLKYLANSGNTLVNLAWFDIEQQNRIVDGSTPGGREQIGAFTRGWELDLRQRFGALELMGQVTQMKARNAVTGLRLSSIAEKNASAWAKYEIGGGWRVGAGLRKIGTVTGNASNPVAPSVTLIDAMLGYRFDAWDLRLDAKNLADKTYVSWCRGANQDCGYGELRQLNLTARYRF